MTKTLFGCIEGRISEEKKESAKRFRDLAKRVKETRDVLSFVPDIEFKESARIYTGIEFYSDITIRIPWDTVEADRILGILMGAGWKIDNEDIDNNNDNVCRTFYLKHPKLGRMRGVILELRANVEPNEDQRCVLIPDGEETITKVVTQKKFKVNCGQNI